MKVIQNLKVPTGNILVVQADRGNLEMLSLGDYGKHHNIKASFLGLDRDLEKVEHTTMLPLEDKWVITISTQYGCACNCSFCDVPLIKFGGNATFNDLVAQFQQGWHLHPEVKSCKHLNVHYARMGEPSFNDDVLKSAKWFKYNFMEDHPGFNIHPVVSTMMPKRNKHLPGFIEEWMLIKNGPYNGNAGLQLSINSTNEVERDEMFRSQAHSLEGIAKIMNRVTDPIGRKITLNFAVAGYEIKPEVLIRYFDPKAYIIKLTPMHKTLRCARNNIKTDGDYTSFHPYKEHEAQLKAAGYDVLVFIASKEEDMGRITCGNAILSGSRPEV